MTDDESTPRKSHVPWFILGGIVVVTFTLAILGPPDEQPKIQVKSNTSELSDNSETEEGTSKKVVETEASSAGRNDYQSALQCYTLADIVNILAQETDQPEIRNSGAWRSDWKFAAYKAGKAAGKSEKQIEADYADEYIRVIGPLRALPPLKGGEYINSLVRKLGHCGVPPVQAVSGDRPNKPAHIVFRDAKIVCPMVLKKVDEREGRQSTVDLLSFAVERKYSKSDTKALLQLCSLYAESGSRP